MRVLKNREDYDCYQQALHSGDYETAFAYYVEKPKLSIFGHRIASRPELRHLYAFLHRYVRETVLVERFAMSEDLLAVEATVRVDALRDLDAQTLREQGLYQFHPISTGESQTMRHYVHYCLRGGKIESGSCVPAPA